MKKLRIGSFLSVVLTLLFIYALVKWGIPAASREITSLPFPLPVPGTLMFFYMVLTIVALFLYVTFSEDGLTDAEARVCDLLYKSRNLPEAAQTLGISINTAKTHLTRSFRKVGVTSQTELLRCLNTQLYVD